MKNLKECSGECHKFVGANWTLSTRLNTDEEDGERNMGIYLDISHDLKSTYI